MAAKKRQEAIPPQPIYCAASYTVDQFMDAVGIKDKRTLAKYHHAGLRICQVPGTDLEFIRGADWFDFIGDHRNESFTVENMTETEWHMLNASQPEPPRGALSSGIPITDK